MSGWTAEDVEAMGATLAATMAVYGRPPLTDAAVAVWIAALVAAGLSRAQAQAALSRHVADPDRGQYPPRPADVVRIAAGGTPEERAAAAWAKVEAAMRRYGAGRSVVFDDAQIHRVVASMGGWPELCRTETRDLPTRSAEFRRRYVAMRDGDAPRVLRGLSADYDEQRGVPPAMIGPGARQVALPAGMWDDDARLARGEAGS